MKEIWINITGYEGFYQISNLGRVRSLDREVLTKSKTKRLIRGVIMTPIIGQHGYPWVSLRKNKKKKTKLIHRLVAEAFIPNPENFPIVNHKDENPLNANVENLEWCTQQYNSTYNGVQERKRKNNVVRGVIQYDKQLNLIKHWNSISEAAKYYNTHIANICACCRGKRKTCSGFIWEYDYRTLSQKNHGKNK